MRAKTVVVSSQHTPTCRHATLKEAIIEEVVKKVVPPEFLDKETVYYINPTGKFVVGGPQGDCGLTGRKIIVDTYGGYGRHGGGAFSGKDPSKVDRSAAYMARYVAKNVVAAELAPRCEVQVAYAIGVADPVSVLVDTFGTGVVPDDKIAKLVRELFDFKPASLIQTLGLKRPIYRRTASYGHFGRVAGRAATSPGSAPTGSTTCVARPGWASDRREISGSGSLGQGLVHQLHADRPFADGRGHALRAAGAGVADDEYARNAGLEQVG